MTADSHGKAGKKMEELQKELTALSLEVAEKLRVELDFSVDSIKEIENILDTLSKDYKKTKNDDGVTGLALEFAAYIVTVIEKHITRGRWERNHPEAGEETFPYYLENGRAIFPYGWCLNRIVNGKNDDI